MTGHLDLDALADVLAGEPASDHLAGCDACQADLDALQVASAQVTTDLAALPAPALPDDVAARLAGLGTPPVASGGTVTTLPARRTTRWLPAAAAAVLLLGGAAFGLTRLGGHDAGSSSTSAGGVKGADTAEIDVVRNSTGTDYTDRAALAAAVPQLLAGSAGAALSMQAPTTPGRGAAPKPAADPLARLRDNAGLAECLLALLPADDPSVRPLALDYASFKGAPAMVVVLPSSLPRKLDVFVVGPGCSRANDSTLFYASVDKP